MLTDTLFKPGAVTATPGAIQTVRRAGQSVWVFLARHVAGDWGDLDPDDRAANDSALRSGGRLLSAYATALGDRVWVITETDRRSTCVLLPDEY